MVHRRHLSLAAFCALAVAASCTDSTADPIDSGIVPQANLLDVAPPPPSGLVSAGFAGRSLQLWPFTGTDLAGSDADPMNILFTGEVDVLSLRAALLALDGDRTAFGFPGGPPFDCVWSDAFGDVQSAWSEGDDWVANPVQLACGDYDPIRFHIRLFPAGENWVMAGTHFDLHITGTADHRVISWELPELLVTADFLRSGLLDATQPVGAAPINPAPAYRAIEPPIFNGMPDALKMLAGLPAGPSAVPVPVPSNGMATILNVATRAPLDRGTTTNHFVLNYDQIIPRPFCASGPLDYLFVQGPVRFEQRVNTNGSGVLESWQIARGELTATPVNPLTGQPTGPTFHARTEDLHTGLVTPGTFSARAITSRVAFPPAGGNGQSYMEMLSVGRAFAHHWVRERC